MRKFLCILIGLSLPVLYVRAQEPVKLWSAPYSIDFFAAKQTSFSYDSKYYAIGDENGRVTIYEAATGKVFCTHQYHSSKVFCTIFQPFGNILASTDKDGKLVLYDYVSQSLIKIVNAHEEPVTALCFSPTGEIVITGSRDNYVKLWKATGEYISLIGKVNGNILALKVTPDGKTLVVGTSSLNEGITLYDLPGGNKKLAYETANIQYLDVSPDNMFIASANLQKPVNIWDIRSGQEAFKLEGHTKYLNSVAFSPAGDILASSGNDKIVNFWDLSKKSSVYSLQGNKIFAGLTFSPDGKYLAIMDEKPLLTIYDVSSLVKQVSIAEQKSKLQQSTANPVSADAPANISASSSDEIEDGIVADIDGNNYLTVTINKITWMASNLRVTHYSNGDPIAQYKDAGQWSKTASGLYTGYKGEKNEAVIKPYGYLYNWYAVNDERNLCPAGWHPASEIDWGLLAIFLGDSKDGGGKLKSVEPFWNEPNVGATDDFEFNALPGGYCGENGEFDWMGEAALWWSVDFTAKPEDTDGRMFTVLRDQKDYFRGSTSKSKGLSVRCVKNYKK